MIYSEFMQNLITCYNERIDTPDAKSMKILLRKEKEEMIKFMKESPMGKKYERNNLSNKPKFNS